MTGIWHPSSSSSINMTAIRHPSSSSSTNMIDNANSAFERSSFHFLASQAVAQPTLNSPRPRPNLSLCPNLLHHCPLPPFPISTRLGGVGISIRLAAPPVRVAGPPNNGATDCRHRVLHTVHRHRPWSAGIACEYPPSQTRWYI